MQLHLSLNIAEANGSVEGLHHRRPIHSVTAQVFQYEEIIDHA